MTRPRRRSNARWPRAQCSALRPRPNCGGPAHSRASKGGCLAQRRLPIRPTPSHAPTLNNTHRSLPANSSRLPSPVPNPSLLFQRQPAHTHPMYVCRLTYLISPLSTVPPTSSSLNTSRKTQRLASRPLSPFSFKRGVRGDGVRERRRRGQGRTAGDERRYVVG
jgi:hypothetical protein